MNKPDAAAGLRAGAWIFLLAVAMALPAGARAQSSVDTSQPIVVRSSKAKIRYAKFSGQILSVDKQTIKVSGTNYDVRTFSFTPKVSAKVAKGLAKGRYGYGQAVQITYVPGSTVASRIKR